MSNYRVKLYIEPEDIYNRFSENDKKRFKSVEILNAEVKLDGTAEIECLVNEREGTQVIPQRHHFPFNSAYDWGNEEPF